MEHKNIYKQFMAKHYKPVKQMAGLQWFALEKNYGKSYGPIHKEYKFKKEPKLLDIGDANVRKEIENRISKTVDNIEFQEYRNPNDQYSGGEPNAKYHAIVQKYYGDKYDGTIIDEKNLKGTEYEVDELAGASEIVLWKEHSDLIAELPTGKIGGKRTRKRTKPKRNKKKSKCSSA